MRKPHGLLWIALLTLLTTASAFAAAPKPVAPAAPAAPAAPHEMTVTVTSDDDADFMADDAMEWISEDGDELMFDGDPGDGSRVVERRIIRHAAPGMGRGPGMGMGRGGPGMGMGHGGGRGGMGGHIAAMFHQLDLTGAQKEKLRDLHERQLRRDIQSRADLQIARLDMHKLMSAEKPDGAALNAQIDKMARLRTDMAKAHVAVLLEARAMLTPEQQKQAHELMLQGHGMGAGMGPGRKLHMQGGPGMGGMPGVDGRQRHMRVKVLRDSTGQGPQ